MVYPLGFTGALYESSNDFTTDLYKVLAEQPGNIFFSPLSIQIALTLVFLGAKGNTALEMARGLHLFEDKNVVADSFSSVVKQLEQSSDVILEVGNRIFLKHGFKTKHHFNQAAAKFLAGTQELNFSNSEESRGIINKWVEQQTNNTIKNIIQPGLLSADTSMVLVNAVYFKGDWLHPFDDVNTQPTTFYGETTKNVLMMSLERRFRYVEADELNSQVLLLPYQGNRFGMMVVLPKEINGLPDLESKLDDVNIFRIVNRMKLQLVRVYLPKFRLEYAKRLEETLQRLGMRSMFDPKSANFSGISDQPLVVSNVVHKAFVDVDEAGTEASASTVLELVPLSLHIPVKRPVIFRADHPFLIFIIDYKTKTILFAGRISFPTN